MAVVSQRKFRYNKIVMKTSIHISLLLLLVMSVLIFSCNQQEKKETTEERNTNNAPINQQENKTPEKKIYIELRDENYPVQIIS